MVRLETLLNFLRAEHYEILQKGKSSGETLISGPRNGDDANSQQVTFFNAKAGEKVFDKIQKSNAALILLDNELNFERIVFPKFAAIAKVTNARRVITELGRRFFLPHPIAGVSEKASVHPSAIIGENCSIASGVVIGESVVIGSHCILEPNVFIHAHSQIGNNVQIKANAVIGGNGFGYVKTESGSYDHMPHFGRVIIEDFVHIGSNTCIDRGSLSDTILRKGCKIDNLVHIAHNVIIGENTLVIANAMVAGSVEIGANSWISPSVSIKNGITIGENSVVGMSSLVLKSVESHSTVAGVPAKPLKK